MRSLIPVLPTLPGAAVLGLFVLFSGPTESSDFASIPTEPTAGDAMLADYFQRETRRIGQRSSTFVADPSNWPDQIPNLRRQLFEMLGLQPLPARSPLRPEITGTTERDGIVVENIVFQSRPGLYVTANYYRPAEQDGPLPTVLYLCGHGSVKIDEVSYGSKAHYQHHGAWFARNGYTCLMIDTLQLGEIEGIHHGTHRFDRWWWNSRGYTPAGVEAWNAIRALDYLETRPEADPEKFGVTGRSGGGAYTFWVAALDERVQAAVPVAGITSMHNHVVDGCIEGHCDCMYMVNTYRWDFPILASLVAPRPMLILNTDRDRIFPLDGVVDVYEQTLHAYRALDAEENLGLGLYEGPHRDTQPLRVAAFHWFERHLKGKPIETEIEDAVAPKLFEPEELKVLDGIPGNERNTFIDEYFTRTVPSTLELPDSAADWVAQRTLVINRLGAKTLRGWPRRAVDPGLLMEYEAERDGIHFSRWTFQSDASTRLPLYFARRATLPPERLTLSVLSALDDEGWEEFLAGLGAAFPGAFDEDAALPELDAEAWEDNLRMHLAQPWGMVYLPPRGIGPTAWTTDESERRHIRRRFALLGQTLDGMRAWDIRCGIQAVRGIEGLENSRLWLQAARNMAGNALYAALHEQDIHRLDLHQPPATHDGDGPEMLNVLRFTDIPQVAAIAAESSRLRIYTDDPDDWTYLASMAKLMDWPRNQVQIRKAIRRDEKGDDAEVGAEDEEEEARTGEDAE